MIFCRSVQALIIELLFLHHHASNCLLRVSACTSAESLFEASHVGWLQSHLRPCLKKWVRSFPQHSAPLAGWWWFCVFCVFVQKTIAMGERSEDATSGNKEQREWATGLFDCLKDQSNSLMTCFLPCVTYAENVTELDKDHSFGKHCCLYFTTIPCCLWIFAYTRRFTLRQKYGLPETPSKDIAVHICCHQCALCQESREIKYRKTVH